MKKKKPNVPLAFPKVKPLIDSFSDIKKIAQSLQIHQIINLALENYQSELSNEKIISEILCLLYICIEYSYQEENEKNLNLLQDIKQKTESFKILENLWKIRCDEKQIYHHPSIDSILLQLSDDNQISEMIKTMKSKNSGNIDLQENEIDKKEKMRQKAKERQERMMNKMKKQQNKFINGNEASKLEKTSPQETQEEEKEKCVLCMESQSDLNKNPLCFITSLFNTNTCHQVRRVNLNPNQKVSLAKDITEKKEPNFLNFVNESSSHESKRQKFSLTTSFDESFSDNNLKIEEIHNMSIGEIEKVNIRSELKRSVEGINKK
jgi:hypothetical protein